MIGILASVMATGGASSGCGDSRTGGPTGTGGGAGKDGSVQGTGGSPGSGGIPSSGGITGTGGIGSGGIGTGGKATGVSGSGGIGSGGIAGTGGKATGGAGSGGVGTGGVDSGSDGVGSGGASALDAGACIGGTCAIDAGRGDTSPNDAPVAACSQITAQAACDLRSDCHAVYVDPGTCGCASPGCCARFDHCADGGKADCTGPATCKMATPFCDPPYVVAFTGTCYEGCVRQTICAPPTCPQAPPTNASTCGSVDFKCFYEDCSGAGRTQAACASGTWTVQTAACSTTACTGAGVTSTTLTCAAGKLCVRTTSGGGAYMVQPSCVDNTCGKGPISSQCIQNLSGNCSGSYTLSDVEINCSLPSSCGQGQGGCA